LLQTPDAETWRNQRGGLKYFFIVEVVYKVVAPIVSTNQDESRLSQGEKKKNFLFSLPASACFYFHYIVLLSVFMLYFTTPNHPIEYNLFSASSSD